MILALEGPDCCGKSTLFAALHGRFDARFVPSMSIPPAVFEHIAYLETMEARTWEALYDPEQLYVCDRHFAVSSWVYSRYSNRKLLVDLEPWRDRVVILYPRVPEDELRRRYALRRDDTFDGEDYGRLLDLYAEVFARHETIVVDGTLPTEVLAGFVVRMVPTWRKHANDQ